MFKEGFAKLFGKKPQEKGPVGPVMIEGAEVIFKEPSAKDEFLADFEDETNEEDLNEKEFVADVAAESRGKEAEGWVNQDACIELQNGRIIGVFDGMGGTGRGDIASSVGVETFGKCYAKSNIAKDKASAENQMKEVMLQANSRIKIEQTASAENSKIGTTFVGSEVWLDKKTREPMLTVGNSGDSIAYLFREGKLEKISKEHSFVSFLNDSLKLNIDDQNDEVLSITLSEYVKKNNISENPQLSRIMGMVIRSNRKAGEMTIGSLRNVTFGGLAGQNIDDREMSINTVKLQKGDKILLCSDGLTDSTTDANIEKIIRGNESKGAGAIKKALIENGIAAQTDENNKRANKKDDITVAWVDFQGFEESEIELDEEDLKDEKAA